MQVYKAGDDILPKVETHRRRERRRRDEEASASTRERRTADDGLQERTRRERQLHPSSADSRPEHRAASGGSRSRERRERAERRDRQPSADAVVSLTRTPGSSSSADLFSLSPPPSSPRHPDAVEARQRGARTVAHQASLRSLVSASESGTGTGESLNEAQLMAEILAEGLLDGINVDELTEAEQDELSEIIAERYRQLHPERLRRAVSDATRQDTPGHSTRRPEPPIEEADRAPRQSSRSSQRQQPQPSPRSSRNVIIGGTETRPPTSFPPPTAEQTLAAPQEAAHRRRASNESRRSESSTTRTGRRSATDLSDSPHSSSVVSERPRHLLNTNRANTEPRTSPRASEVWQASGRQVASPPQIDSPIPQSPGVDAVRPLMSSVNVAPVPTSMTASELSDTAPKPAVSAVASSVRFEEPSISCGRCARPNVQYEVHKHCGPCKLDLCLRCYRAGRGCNHWFGFGHAAMFKFESSHPLSRSSQAIELPHLLTTRQYQRPPPAMTEDGRANVGGGSSDPASRLREGNFCDRCGNWANECFWSCDYCNDGEWGFCNNCVNTSHCCTHPLLPIAHKSVDPNATTARPTPSHSGSASLSPYHVSGRASSPAHSAPSSATSANGLFPGLGADIVPLVITTNCDLCLRPISPEETRYHCPGHPTPVPEDPELRGDFDVCSTCYHGFVKTGQMKREDGPEGWRLCPDGHRMIAVAFEPDKDDGQRRVVVRDLVGGFKMTEADMAAWKLAKVKLDNVQPAVPVASLSHGGQWTWREDPAGTRRTARARSSTLPPSNLNATKFPPEGGVGKICRAQWSYYPEEGDDGKGELMFPKHAEVREVEQINEDWWFGVYAGDMGVFPAVYVRERRMEL